MQHPPPATVPSFRICCHHWRSPFVPHTLFVVHRRGGRKLLSQNQVKNKARNNGSNQRLKQKSACFCCGFCWFRFGFDVRGSFFVPTRWIHMKQKVEENAMLPCSHLFPPALLNCVRLSRFTVTFKVDSQNLSNVRIFLGPKASY